MENTIYIALSRQATLRQQMDVTANNLANMNTSGYKAQRMLFLEYVERPDRRGDRMSFVQDFGTMRNMNAGPINVTQNPLDVALRGEGYFTVETFAGPRYTRAGSFQLNNDRELVDRNGLPVLDDQDNRIIIPADATDIRITGDGSVMNGQQAIARLKVVRFADDQRMLEMGGGLYDTEQQPEIMDRPQVVQGAIEGSNVIPVIEMTQMIEVSRQYASAQRMAESEHERQRTMIRQLVRAQ